MVCGRHPLAAAAGGHCPACLLEEALATEGGALSNRAPVTTLAEESGSERFTVLLPLGESRLASIFLVRAHDGASRLLRLKTWRPPAPPQFLARFQEMRARLDGWADRQVDRPIAAFVDADGRASVLSEFKRGVPIMQAVGSGHLDREVALARLASLMELMRRAHERDLVHGSIGAGNVMVQTGSSSCWLLDFGLASLMTPAGDAGPLPAADIAGLADLSRRLRQAPLRPGAPPM